MSTSPSPLIGVINSMAYGYKLSVKVNTIPLEMQGNQSESVSLFSHDDPQFKQIPEKNRAAAQQYFPLKVGANTLEIEYEKVGDGELTFDFSLEGYPLPVFLMNKETDKRGKITQSLQLSPTPPKDFKTVYIPDGKMGAFVHVRSMSCMVSPTLNGEMEMTLGGMPGSIPLKHVKPGKNTLKISFSCSTAPATLEGALVSSKGVVPISWKVPDTKTQDKILEFSE